jgi:nicotinate-nucleotide pyrophosphorylase (carboxylating)
MQYTITSSTIRIYLRFSQSVCLFRNSLLDAHSCWSLRIHSHIRSMLAHLLPPSYKSQAISWLSEDCPSFDIAGFVVGDQIETAQLFCKQTCVLAGIPFMHAILEHLSLSPIYRYSDGDLISVVKGQKALIAHITGPSRLLLLAERTCLNILSRASGVATAARRLASIKESQGWHGSVAGTRKTTPGFRMVEKYALLVGGVDTHRMDLSQMVMLKDNHVDSAGGVKKAVEKARAVARFSVKVEVESRDLDQALEAAEAGADIVMLDNMTPIVAKSNAKVVKEKFPYVLIEASGVSTTYIAEYIKYKYMKVITSTFCRVFEKRR